MARSAIGSYANNGGLGSTIGAYSLAFQTAAPPSGDFMDGVMTEAEWFARQRRLKRRTQWNRFIQWRKQKGPDYN